MKDIRQICDWYVIITALSLLQPRSGGGPKKDKGETCGYSEQLFAVIQLYVCSWFN